MDNERPDISPEHIEKQLNDADELDDESRLTLLQDIHARLESSLDESVEPTDAA